jgi:putative SOS response-associated peptidase YedK
MNGAGAVHEQKDRLALTSESRANRGMCGKFTQRSAAGYDETVTPMRFADVVALDGNGARKTVRMRWGLVPSNAADPASVKPNIHARAETIDTKPTFREAFAKRRGLVIVTSFNEGEELTPTKTAQYVLTAKDDAPLAIAVIWERWNGGDNASLLSFAMVTVEANPLVATITDRMPAVIDEADWPKWLGEEDATVAELKAMLRPSARDFDMRRAEKPPPAKPDAKQLSLF